MLSKKELRSEIKIKLSENSKNFEKWSNIICDFVLNSELYKKSDSILAYMALSDEVNLSKIIEKAVIDNKKVYIPRIIPDTNNMDFYLYNPNNSRNSNISYDSETVISKGSFGILEPLNIETNKLTLDYYKNSNESFLILVPGRAFTKTGLRLGRGKGFYDKYLSQLLNAAPRIGVTAGICFSLQLIDTIPTDEFDISMNYIISEKGII